MNKFKRRLSTIAFTLALMAPSYTLFGADDSTNKGHVTTADTLHDKQPVRYAAKESGRSKHQANSYQNKPEYQNTHSRTKVESSSESSNLPYYLGMLLFFTLLISGTWYLTMAGSGRKTYGDQIGNMVLFVSISLLICIAGLSGMSIYKVHFLGNEMEKVTALHMPLSKKMTAVVEHQLEQSLALERFLRLKETSFQEEFDHLGEKVDAELVQARQIAEDGEHLASNQIELERLKYIERHLDTIKEHHHEYTLHGDELFALMLQGAEEGVLKTKEENLEKETDKLNQELISFITDLQKDTDNASSMAASVIYLVAVMAFISMLLGIAFLVYSRRKLLNLLKIIIDNLSSSSENISEAADQAMKGSQNLSEGTHEASASLQETASSITEISSMVKKNNDNSKEASGLASASRDSAENGEKEILELISSMHGISKSSKKIEEIISVIDDIAFQTNLLALNAAVEAARAGEQGKGFAVVAEAVRNLAQRSAESAKEISSLIKENVSQAENGVKIADSSGKVLNEIVTNAKKVADLINEVSAASDEQSEGIQQITTAVSQIQVATQRNASTAEEFSASSQELSAQGAQLNKLVNAIYTLEGDKMNFTPVAGIDKANYISNNVTPPQKAKKNPSTVIPLDGGDDDEDLKDVSGF